MATKGKTPAYGKGFAMALASARAEAGFPTAYKFYHNNGGRRHFPFTYAYYARFERGAAVPRPKWLASILAALRVAIGEDGHRVLMRHYLVDLLGGEDAYALIAGPLLAPVQAGPAALGREALRWMKSNHAVHLTPEQFCAVASDETAYWCSEALLNDSGSWTAEDLAAAFELPSKAVSAALRRLKSAGLVVSAPGGKFRGRWSGKLYTFPGRLAGMNAHLDRIKGFWKKMERRRGAPFAERVELVRARTGGMRNYWRSLEETLDAANAFGTRHRAADSGLFVIEARVRRLAEF